MVPSRLTLLCTVWHIVGSSGLAAFPLRARARALDGEHDELRSADQYNARMDISDDDLRACVRVLRAIEADRSHLTRLTQEQRRELLTLAGLVAKPERHDLVQMAKAFRRAEREAAKEHDRKAIEQAGLRIQRRSACLRRCGWSRRSPRACDERPELNQERDRATSASSPL